MATYRRPSGSGGPTNTFSVQQTFAERLRGALARINARIREAVEEGDAFNLKTEALADDVPEEVFETDSRRAAVSGFLAWLREQLDTEFLGIVGPDRNEFIRQAYATGLRNANTDLSELDVGFTTPEVSELLDAPIHRSALQTLYTRTYENLVSVRDDVAQAVRDTLIDGFVEGESPRTIARSLTDRVDSIGKHRATLIARSEIINAHSEAQLNRYQNASDETGVDVGVRHGEWQTAGDDRVCAFCQALNGSVFTISEMRNETFTLGSQTFRLRPPAHPMGRCRILPEIGIDFQDLAPLDDRLPSETEIQ